MKTTNLIAFAALLCTTIGAPGRAQTTAKPIVTTANLLAEMSDLASMTRYPNPAYATRQNSSYDRASVAPDKPGWFANADFGKYLRQENRDGRVENVMMDARGPGAVVHLWTANPSGTLRIYLDGSATPVLEGEMARLMNGETGALPAPLATITARGFNLYFPIPYANACKITVESNDSARLYYTIAHRDYAAGTPIETFRREQLDTLKPQIASAAMRLNSPSGEGVWPTQIQPFEFNVAPGATTNVAVLSGAKAIAQFVVRVRPELSESALRALVLRVSFDGKQTTETPLGDFFGTAPGPNAFSTLPLGVTPEHELWSHWLMPFRQNARVQIVNMGRETVHLRGQIGTAPYAWNESSMYFYAGYISRYDVETKPRDLNVLRVRGQGVFAGLSYAVDNPSIKWWGEGDEKITVDGEAFPSWLGTGTEDYFGYAWCNTTLFSQAYHAQPRAEGPGGCGGGRGHWGRASNNRFHILDRIPFTRSFNFDIELLHHRQDVKVNVATVAYWYAKSGATNEFAPLTRGDLEVRAMPEYQPAPKVAGAIEGESMRVVAKTAEAAPQENLPPNLSGDAHLWWHGAPKIRRCRSQ